MSISPRRLIAILATLAASVTLSIPAGSAFAATAAQVAPAGRAAAQAGHSTPAPHAAGSRYEPLPNLPVNTCQDSSLPRDYGTNFPVPSDPTASASPTRP